MFSIYFKQLNNFLGTIIFFIVINFFSLISLANTFNLISTPQIKQKLDITDTGRIVFRFFDDSAGLPQNTINTIAVDQKGYIWVGTQDGAAYYNGQNWTTVSMPNRTRSNWVYSIFVGKDGAIWFGTNGGGLSRYQNGSWITYDTKSGLPSDQVRSFLETSNSNGKSVLWAGTSNGLAYFEEGVWKVYNTNSGLPNNTVRCLVETINSEGSHAIWIGTDEGLASFEKGKWISFNINSGLSNNVIRGLAKSKTNKSGHALWIATEGGIARFDSGDWTIYKDKDGLSSNETRCILETYSPKGDPILWVGTGGFGLTRFEQGKWSTYTTKSGLPDNSVWSLLETTSPSGAKTLWVGMASRGGLAKLELGKWISFNNDSGLPNTVVFSINERKKDDGSSAYWIGTDGGLAYWDGTWKTYDIKSGLPNNTVRALLESKEKDGRTITWVGTEGGLVKIDGKKWKIFDNKSGLPSNRIYCLSSTKNPKGETILFVGTREGLAVYENEVWHHYDTQNSSLPNNVVRSLLSTVDSNNQETIWIGTESGLASLKSGQITSSNDLPQNIIRGISKFQDQNKEWLWIGTDSGVYWKELYNPSATWERLSDTTTPALPNNTIYQIVSDGQNRIYLSTNKGVVRLTKIEPNKTNSSNYNIYNFTIKDGLPNNECNSGAALADSLGRIWVGTIGGVALFDPSKEPIDNAPKPFYLEQLLVSGKPQKVDNSNINLGKLAYDQNQVKFEYSLLSYFRESDSQYKFQLVGYDQNVSDWTSESKKEYQNLGAGSYTFNVWAKDYLGNVSGPISVSFQIKPAPWYSWWAFSLYLIILIWTVYALHNYRLQRLSQQNIALEAKVNERTYQLEEKNQELLSALEQVKISHKQTEEKNQELAIKNVELDNKNAELANKNLELIQSHKQADRIFSALAQALPGTVLDGKYKLEEKIGSGGFGAVYKATYLTLEKFVAVKVFRPTPGNDSIEALERFQLEAVSSCRINHPNSVAVLDSGVSEQGIAYLVMELLNGRSLKKEILEKKKFSLRRCVEILIPICDVLEKAHQAGVVHRDIKPDNIFLHKEEKEIIKVVDFGIAKIIDGFEVNGSNLTNTGSLLGTPAYMSPERLTGQAYDGRSDIYSLGVMFYQMLSGQLPFAAAEDNLSSLILKHLVETPLPLTKLRLNIPITIEALILKMLEKDQSDRPTLKQIATTLSSLSETDLDLYDVSADLPSTNSFESDTLNNSSNSLKQASSLNKDLLTITGKAKVTGKM